MLRFSALELVARVGWGQIKVKCIICMVSIRVETDFITFWWKASHFLPRKSTFSVVWLLVRVRWGQDGVRLMIFIYMLGMVFDHAYIEFEPSRGLRRWFTAVSVWCILSSFSDNHGHNIWIGMKNAESPSPLVNVVSYSVSGLLSSQHWLRRGGVILKYFQKC